MRSYFKRADPFFAEKENHCLIGVANVFLACLFCDVKLQYAVPIINQKGEVMSRLWKRFATGTRRRHVSWRLCSRWLVGCTWRCGAAPRALAGEIQNRAALSGTPPTENLRSANWSVW